jgi:hypothetical protein
LKNSSNTESSAESYNEPVEAIKETIKKSIPIPSRRRFIGETENSSSPPVGWVLSTDVIEHPSHELLKKNGFIQQKYHKFRVRALHRNKKYSCFIYFI